MADKLILDVEGMTCEHCVMRVHEALSGVDGVTNVKVKLKKKEARVKYEGAVDENALIKAVEEAGYKGTVKK